MKKIRVAVLAMALMLIMGTMSVFGADEYEHKIDVSAGNGSFDKTVSFDGATSAEVTTGENAVLKINGSEVAKITPPSDKHFVIGLKKAGRDNSVAAGAQTLKDEDQDYVVAYGLKSNMVKYRVEYRIAGTDDPVPGLPDSEEFYGVRGDKPVVSWRYAENYLPQAYNMTGTIGDETVFTFEYYEVEHGTGRIITIVDNNGGGAAPAGGGGGAGGGAGGAGGDGGAAGGAGAADGANIGDGATPAAEPADLVDIDNGETPTTDNPDGTTPDSAEIDDNQTPKANWGLIGGGAAAVVAIAAAALAIARRRRKEDEE